MIDQNKNNYKTLFWIIFIVALIALLVLGYFFLAKPRFDKYIVGKQIEASDYIIASILYQVQQQGYVSLNYLNNSITLIPYTQGGNK